MKLLHTINKSLGLILLFSIAILISCTTTHTAGKSGKIPPGKAKKIHGTKSAKPFAPGQSKKD